MEGDYGKAAINISDVVDMSQEDFYNLPTESWKTVDQKKVLSYAKAGEFNTDFIKENPYILKCLYCDQFKRSGQGMRTHVRGNPDAANFYKSICKIRREEDELRSNNCHVIPKKDPWAIICILDRKYKFTDPIPKKMVDFYNYGGTEAHSITDAALIGPNL